MVRFKFEHAGGGGVGYTIHMITPTGLVPVGSAFHDGHGGERSYGDRPWSARPIIGSGTGHSTRRGAALQCARLRGLIPQKPR